MKGAMTTNSNIAPGGGYGNDPYTQSANAYGAALNTASGPSSALAGMGMYANPFENQVVQNSMNDMMRTNQMMQGQNAAGAANAGAFGGSRHGVVESLTNADTMRQMGDMSSNLRMQGWNNAANLANQDFQNRMQQSGQLANLSNQGFGYGRQLTQDQMAQGNQQQQLLQSILTGGAQQFDQFMNSPYQALDVLRAGVSGNPLTGNMTTQGTATAQANPGKGGLASLAGQGIGMATGKGGGK